MNHVNYMNLQRYKNGDVGVNVINLLLFYNRTL